MAIGTEQITLEAVSRGWAEARAQIESTAAALGMLSTKGLAGMSQAELTAASNGLLGAGVAAATALGAAAAAAVHFDDVARTAASNTGLAADQLEKLKKAAQAPMFAQMGFGASEVATAFANMTRSTGSVEAAMKPMTDAARLARAAHIELAEAGGMVTSVARQWGLGISDATRIVDVLASTDEVTSMSMADMGEAMRMAAPAARMLGWSMEQTLGVIAQLEKTAGVDGAGAGKVLRGALDRLSDASTGAKEALAEMGVTTSELDAAMQNPSKLIALLGRQSWDAANAFKVFGANGAQITSVFRAGAGSYDQIIEKIKGVGTATKRANEEMKTVRGIWEQIKASAEDLAVVIGTPLVGAVRDLVDKLGRGATYLLNLPDWMKRAATYAAVAATALLLFSGAVLRASATLAALKIALAAVKALGLLSLGGISFAPGGGMAANMNAMMNVLKAGMATVGRALATAALSGLGLGMAAVAAILAAALVLYVGSGLRKALLQEGESTVNMGKQMRGETPAGKTPDSAWYPTNAIPYMRTNWTEITKGEQATALGWTYESRKGVGGFAVPPNRMGSIPTTPEEYTAAIRKQFPQAMGHGLGKWPGGGITNEDFIMLQSKGLGFYRPQNAGEAASATAGYEGSAAQGKMQELAQTAIEAALAFQADQIRKTKAQIAMNAEQPYGGAFTGAAVPLALKLQDQLRGTGRMPGEKLDAQAEGMKAVSDARKADFEGQRKYQDEALAYYKNSIEYMKEAGGSWQQIQQAERDQADRLDAYASWLESNNAGTDAWTAKLEGQQMRKSTVSTEQNAAEGMLSFYRDQLEAFGLMHVPKAQMTAAKQALIARLIEYSKWLQNMGKGPESRQTMLEALRLKGDKPDEYVGKIIGASLSDNAQQALRRLSGGHALSAIASVRQKDKSMVITVNLTGAQRMVGDIAQSVELNLGNLFANIAGSAPQANMGYGAT